MADVVDWLRGLDPRSRADMGDKLAGLMATASPLGGSVCSELVEELSGWLKTSNTRVVLGGLGALKILVERKGDAFRLHILEAMPALRDLLSDSHDQVRDLLLDVLYLLMAADKPAAVFEHLVPALGHRAWRVRQTVLMCFEQMLSRCGRAGVRACGRVF